MVLLFVNPIKIYIFGQILVKLTHFVHLNNSFRSIDFEENWTISEEKVAFLSWKWAFLVNAIQSALFCGKIFVKLAQFVFIINSLKPIDFEKKIWLSVREKHPI